MYTNPFIHWNNYQQVQSIPMAPQRAPLDYVRPGATIAPMAVPTDYRDATTAAAAHAMVNPQKFAGQINAENGGNWSPTLRGRADPTDHGITQMNPMGESIITGKSGPKVNYFKNNYGVEYDPQNPTHQILGMGVLEKYLRQYGLPSAGVNPTQGNVQTAYNTGAQGLANAQAGKGSAATRAGNYRSLLGSYGVATTTP